MTTTSKNSRPPRRKQAERREETQRKLLDSAIAILRVKGYAGLKTMEVAKLAAVSRGALTHHYPSKELLVASALEDVFVEARLRGLQRARSKGTLQATLKALLADCEDFYFSGFFRIAIELATVSGPDSEIASRARDISGSNRTPVETAWAAALKDAGVESRLCEDIVSLASSMVRGLALRKLLKDDPTRFKRLIAMWLDTMVNQLTRNRPTSRK
jgi:AcrR family transcriptional regulator